MIIENIDMGKTWGEMQTGVINKNNTTGVCVLGRELFIVWTKNIEE